MCIRDSDQNSDQTRLRESTFQTQTSTWVLSFRDIFLIPSHFSGPTKIFFQSPAPNSEGKFLTLGGPMIALVERGREMPFPIRLLTENLAQRKLLSFRPPGLRVERGAFSGNNARDFPKSDFGTRGQTSYRGRPYCLLYTS